MANNQSDAHQGKSSRTSFDFNQNRGCRYYPCHPGADPESFNCKHCYCPLYFVYWLDCGGTYEILPSGIKDCTPCLLPHSPSGHAHVVSKLKDWFERLSKTEDVGDVSGGHVPEN